MSPRQLLRSFEVRAPETPRPLGQQTDRQVRQYPDGAGAQPFDATVQDHLDIVASRMRLNAGSLDWRQGPAGGGGSGNPTSPTTEAPDGLRDGTNVRYTTSAKFVPQSVQFYVNGMRQQISVVGDADFTIEESGGAGSGFDTLILAWAPLPQDQMVVDYQADPTTGVAV